MDINLGLFLLNVWDGKGNLVAAHRVDTMDDAVREAATYYVPGGVALATGFFSGRDKYLKTAKKRKRARFIYA